MDATVPPPPQSVVTNNIDSQGGNDKSFNSESYFLAPTVPQPLNAFAKNFGAFDLAGYMDPGSLTGPLHPPESTQGHHCAFMHGPRQDDPPVILPTNSRVSDGTSSEYPLPNKTPSRSGLQGSGSPPVIQSMARSEVVTSDLLKNGEAFVVEGTTLNYNLPVMSPPSTHAPAPAVDEPLIFDQSEGVVGMPDWVVPIKPLPLAGENVIKLRRDSYFALEIIPAHLPMGSLEGCNGVKVPATASVKNLADTTGKTCLEFRVHLYGATTKELYEFVCKNCQGRMGKRRGTPSLIDFKAEYDMIEQKNGKIRVEFSFCCYPKCHKLGDTEYLLDIILSKDEGQNHIVAQCRLPFSFNIFSKLPPRPRPSTIPGTRKRPQPEADDGDPRAPKQRTVRRRMGNANALAPKNPPGNGQIHSPALDIGNQSSPRGQEDGPSSSLVISTPKVDGERPPTLTEVNPDSASITGGVRIWLKGMDFPALLPLFARFGAAIVPTTFSSSNLLACHLPPRTTPGVINVTLSKHPFPNAPEYGTSIATFKYKGDHDELISILLRIKDQAYSPLLQAVLTALHDQGKLALDPVINTLEPTQAQPAYHFPTASGPTLGFGSAVGQPEPLHAGIGTPSFTSSWSFPTNISDPRTHRPQDFQFRSTPTPFMNQGSNPSAPLNSTTQPYQLNSGNSFFSSLDNIGAPSLSGDSRYPDNLMGHMKHNQILDAAGNKQSPVPVHGAQAMDGWHSASAQPLPVHGESIRVQSLYEDNPSATGMPSQGQVAYSAELHGSLATPVPMYLGYSSVIDGTGVSSTTNRAVQEQNSALVNVPHVGPEAPILAQIPHQFGGVPHAGTLQPASMPPQGLVQPYSQPQALPPPFMVEAGMRPEFQTTGQRDRTFARSGDYFPSTEEESQLDANDVDVEPLEPSLVNCSVWSPYENKRHATGIPFQGLTPSQATHPALGILPTIDDSCGSVIEPRSYKQRLGAPPKFRSNQEQDNVLTNASVLEPERPIFEHTSSSTRISFGDTPSIHAYALHPRSTSHPGYVPPVPPPSIRKQIFEFEDESLDEEETYSDSQSLKVHVKKRKSTVLPDVLAVGARSLSVARKKRYLSNVMMRRIDTEGYGSRQRGRSNLRQRDSSIFSPDYIEPRASIHSHSKGTWAVRQSGLSVVHSPPVPQPDEPRLNLSRPEKAQVQKASDSTTSGEKAMIDGKVGLRTSTRSSYGYSSLVAPLSESLRDPVYHTTFDGTQDSKALQGRNRFSSPRDAPIETGLLEALRHLQLRNNFGEIISTTNDWGQTLAHLSIFYGYASLLSSLVDWRINLTIADVNGFTALHYAYMKGDLDGIRILRRGGASETVVDKLGRTPLEMQPEGFGSSVDNDARVATELVYPMGNDSDE